MQFVLQQPAAPATPDRSQNSDNAIDPRPDLFQLSRTDRRRTPCYRQEHRWRPARRLAGADCGSNRCNIATPPIMQPPVSSLLWLGVKRFCECSFVGKDPGLTQTRPVGTQRN